MAKKAFWRGMLVMVLAFGMTVIGCGDTPEDDYDNRPSLRGSTRLDNYHPVVGETITASYTKYSNDPDPIGTVTWIWYKTNKKITLLSDVENETVAGYGSTYTVKQSDVGFWLWAIVKYSGNSSFGYDHTVSTAIGIPATATVSVSMTAVYSTYDSIYLDNHKVTVTLTLSDGRWNDVTYSAASQWLTMSGTPLVSTWSNPSVSAWGRELIFSYSTRSDTTLSINNLTATLNTAQLGTMRSSTNVYNTLSAGTPATASVSQWTISQY